MFFSKIRYWISWQRTVTGFHSRIFYVSSVAGDVWKKLNYLDEKSHQHPIVPCTKIYTYIMAIPQWYCVKLVTDFIMYIPISSMVGTIVIGPMNRSNTPTSPVAPIIKCIAPAAIKLPCNCRYN